MLESLHGSLERRDGNNVGIAKNPRRQAGHMTGHELLNLLKIMRLQDYRSSEFCLSE
jgi:hypothetical protein